MADETAHASIGAQMAESWTTTLEINAAFDRPWVEATIGWLLEDGPVDLVVDVGCGTGGAARAFAAALPTSSRVLAFDPDPRLLALARRATEGERLDDRIEWSIGEVGALPVSPGSADLVWASGVIHHMADQQSAVAELAALTHPSGRVVLVEGGLPLRCLPHELGAGRPGLESRLDEARARWFADMRAELPGVAMPYGWPEALRQAGLTDVLSRSFIAEATPPIDDVGWQIVEQHLTSALDELGDRVDSEDRETLTRLLDPSDPLFVGRRDDLIVTAVRTVHVGTR